MVDGKSDNYSFAKKLNFQATSTQKYLTNTLIIPSNHSINSKYLKNGLKTQNQTNLVLDFSAQI
jgi:hypothetical protein